jgi:hypothetical protein
MGTSLYVTDTSGVPLGNALITCGSGCATSNAGGGFYYADVNLTPSSGAITVVAPGKMPTVETWFTNLFRHGRVALEDIPEAAPSKW